MKIHSNGKKKLILSGKYGIISVARKFSIVVETEPRHEMAAKGRPSPTGIMLGYNKRG